MPYTRRRTGVKGRKVYRKRGTKAKRVLRRKRRSAPTQAVFRSPTALPDKIYLKMRYTDAYVYTCTAGATQTQVMRGNDIFDPDFTGTGHQPYSRDQWANFYSTYRVLGSSIKAIAAPSNTSNQVGYWFAVCPHGVSQAQSLGPYPLLESPYVRYKMSNQYQGVSIIKHYISTRKILGLAKAAIQQDNYAAAFGSSPVDQWFWQISIRPSDVATAIVVNVTIMMTYYVELSDRVDLSAS
jgi:hypothetical protein